MRGSAEEPNASKKQGVHDYVKEKLERLAAPPEDDPSFYGVTLFSCGCDYADCFGNVLFFRNYGGGFEIELISHFEGESISFEVAKALLRLKRTALENEIATIDLLLNTADITKE